MFVVTRRAWLGGVLALGSFGGACTGGARSMPPSAPSPLAGKPLPKLARRTLGGEPLDGESFAGRVVVVKFFADYCAPCKRTLPAAEALHRAHPGVAFVGVSEDERASTAEELVSRYQISFPVIHDAGQVIAGRFRVNELPATFVTGKDGLVRWVGGKDQGEESLRDAIEAAERPA
ncbi:MAG: TlpA disulfide reductase family protein [Polyangiaceae bacterium]